MMCRILCFFLFISLLACSSGSQNDGLGDDYQNTPTKYPKGEQVYNNSCIACHQENGEGVEGAFPPLANSDYLLADRKRAITIAAKGMQGEITVNGINYNAIMAPQGLSHEEVKDVVNYILNQWGNQGGEVDMEDVVKAIGLE